MPTYITRKELASMLRLTVATLESPRFRKVGPKYYRFGKQVCYLDSDVQAWLSTRAVEVLPA